MRISIVFIHTCIMMCVRDLFPQVANETPDDDLIFVALLVLYARDIC
jgi:hypothetical protein